MTDPGGGHGWRTGRHVPRERASLLGFGRLAERASLPEDRPLCVLLLPGPVEELAERDPVERLLAAPGVVAVEPAWLASRLPEAIADGLAAVQARRLRLPGYPRAVALFRAREYRLARALLALHPDAELWYAGAGEGVLHELAGERAELRFSPSGELDVLWDRIERLGIASGRLGSERRDVT